MSSMGLDPVWTDPLEGMEMVPLRTHIPEWLVLAPQTRRDMAWVLHHIAKTGFIEAQHCGSDMFDDRPDIPEWPTAEQFAAAERTAEWLRTQRGASAVHASHASRLALLSPGRRERESVPTTRPSSAGSVTTRMVDGRGDVEPEGEWHISFGDEEALVCWRCGEVWMRQLERGRKPHLCPDCR